MVQVTLDELLEKYGSIDSNNCFVFKYTTNNSGYGSIWVQYPQKTKIGIHRLAWEIANNKDLGSLYIHHLCKNRKCFNPRHLKACTQIQNMTYYSHEVRATGAYRCGHPRSIDNSTYNGLNKSGAATYRCSTCNRKSGREKRGWKATTV